jgi:uncharacterized protein
MEFMMSPKITQRSRRLQKKLHVGEFQELGFEISFQFQKDLANDLINQFWDDFIIEAIEQNGLAFGGGTQGFASLWKRGSVTEVHRDLVRKWLSLRPELLSFELGELVDAYYPPES